MTGRIKTLAALTLAAGTLMLALTGADAAPVRDHHELSRHAPAAHGPERPEFVKSRKGTQSPYTGENGYLGLNDMLVDPNGRPPRTTGGGPGPNSPATMLPVPLPATLPLLLGGIALIGAVRHRRRRAQD